jgi:hypothetical protein
MHNSAFRRQRTTAKKEKKCRLSVRVAETGRCFYFLSVPAKKLASAPTASSGPPRTKIAIPAKKRFVVFSIVQPRWYCGLFTRFRRFSITKIFTARTAEKHYRGLSTAIIFLETPRALRLSKKKKKRRLANKNSSSN